MVYRTIKNPAVKGRVSVSEVMKAAKAIHAEEQVGRITKAGSKRPRASNKSKSRNLQRK